MQVLSTTNFRTSAPILEGAIQLLDRGGWLALPSETGYRLVFRDPPPLELSQSLGWAPQRPFGLLLGEPADAEQHAQLSKVEERLLEFFWPGPLVLLARRRILNQEGPTWRKISLRCPNHPLPLEILRRCPFPLSSRALRNQQGKCMRFPEQVVDFLADKALLEGQVLQHNAPCLELEPTVVEVGEIASRVLRRGFISIRELGLVIPGPILLSDELPVLARRRDELAPRVTLILVEGEAARVARRLKTLLESYAEAPVILLSRETADILQGGQEVRIADLGPRLSEQYLLNLGRAWEELDARSQELNVLVEGVPRSDRGAELMDRLTRRARHIINTEDPGYRT